MDVDPNSWTSYDSSGLAGPKGDWTPKPSWYYVYTMKNALTGMKYLAEQASGNSNVWIYKFKSTTDNSGAYVLWYPTRDGTTVNNYQLSLSGTPETAALVSMQSGYTSGIQSSLTIQDSKVTVNVSERPIFVRVNNIN